MERSARGLDAGVCHRPTLDSEYVYLLSKSSRYYFDADAVRVAMPQSSIDRYAYALQGTVPTARQPGGDIDRRLREKRVRDAPSGRARRNSDWFFESWQGLMLDDDDDPLALVVNPQPFKGSHFATFPPKLVEPMIKASTRPCDTVLDCFGGAGTVGLVADRLGRDAVLIDLKPDYAAMAHSRIADDAPLFTELWPVIQA